MSSQVLNGDQAFAQGAVAAGITMVTSYPGSPSSGTVDTLISLAKTDDFYIEWSSNERVALEMAIGASIAGRRALVCTKSVGMNVMLDPLMALNLTPVNGGLVILLGDDPGGYGSQNDQDTRSLTSMLEMPMMEPATPSEAYHMMQAAFELSESVQIPVILRETRSFTHVKEVVEISTQRHTRRRFEYARESLRYVPAPKNVVEKHRALHARLTSAGNWGDQSGYNRITGNGQLGLIGAGFAYAKLMDVIGGLFEEKFKLLKIGFLYPVPRKVIVEFLKSCTAVLVIEEGGPFVENQVKIVAQENDCVTRIFGKASRHLPGEGELFRWQIQAALEQLWPDFKAVNTYLQENEASERPEKESYCGDCRYDEVLDLLEEAAASLGQELALVGDPGCLVTVADRLDAKYAIGSAVAVADGMSKAGMKRRLVALIGDSGFFHTSLPAICNAVHNGSKIVVVVLDNGTTLTSGGQPHPGVARNALGEKAPSLSIAKISKACGMECVKTVRLDDPREAVIETLKEILGQPQLAMLILRIPGARS